MTRFEETLRERGHAWTYNDAVVIDLAERDAIVDTLTAARNLLDDTEDADTDWPRRDVLRAALARLDAEVRA